MYKFFIRNAEAAKSKKALASLCFTARIQGIVTQFSTGVKVDAVAFIEKSEAKKSSTLDNYLKSVVFYEAKKDSDEESVSVYDKLEEISDAVSSMVKAGADKAAIKERIALIVNAEKEKRANDYREEKKKAKEAVKEQKRQSVLEYVNKFLADIQDGRQTSKGEQYSKNTIRVWRQFQRVFAMFYNKHPFTWKEIDRTVVGKFQKFMADDGQAKTTSAKYMGCLRTIIRFAFDDDVNDNPKSLRLIKIANAKEHEKAKEIYLTDEEVRALYDMELSGLYDKVRDVFLMGCFTAQRFSDYSKISKDDYRVTDRGTEVLDIIQQKTKKKAVVPILNDMERAILEKYDYTMPKVVEQVLNRYMKTILHKLSEQVPSLAKKEVTMLYKSERKAEENNDDVNYERNAKGEVIKAKWEMVSSHTARRTGATLMYLSGRYNITEMMRITGHSTYKIFEEYIKLSGDEFADDIKKRKEREEETF